MHAHTKTHSKAQRQLRRRQLPELKSSPAPPASLTTVEMQEQGSACRGGLLLRSWSLKEACGKEGFSGRGSALLEVLDISGKPFFAMHGSRFLYPAVLFQYQRKDGVKETCNRITFRKGQGKQPQCNPQKRTWGNGCPDLKFGSISLYCKTATQLGSYKSVVPEVKNDKPTWAHVGRKSADPNYPTIHQQPGETTNSTSGYPAAC